MKNNKKILAFIIASMTFTSIVPTYHATTEIFASTQQRVILDGNTFVPNAPIEIYNDRMLVPFREFGEAMGAIVNWEPASQRITMLRGNKYSIMVIGQSTVQYGNFSLDENGTVIFETQNFAQMDAPATIINNLTYIPLRALSETLGANVDWNPSTSTVVITSAPVESPTTPPNTTNPTPLPEPIPNPPVEITPTNHFRIISSMQAQTRHQNSNHDPFILVYYDSNSSHSQELVPGIQTAARNADVRVHALDKSSPSNNNTENAWMWRFVRQENLQDPAIFFVYSRDNVTVQQRPTNMTTLEQSFRRFNVEAETGIEMGDFRNTNHFRNMTSSQINTMYRNNEEFIFVLYDSTDDDSAIYVPIMKASARETRHLIYGVDIDSNRNYESHLNWVSDINHRNRDLPMVITVNNTNNRSRIDTFIQPSSVNEGISIIEEFLDNTSDNRQDFDDIQSMFFQNVSAREASDMFSSNRNEYIIVVYDSRINTRNEVLAIEEASTSERYLVYGLNLSSTRNNNTNSNDLRWIPNNTLNTLNRGPIMIHVRNGRIINDENVTSSRNAETFIRRANNW